MNDDDFKQMSDRLYAYLQDREGESRITHGKPWPWLLVDRDGCIALAAALLRLVVTPIPPGRRDVAIPLPNLNQVNEAPYDLELFVISRVESIDFDRSPPEEFRDTPIRDSLSIAGCALVGLMLIGCFATGLIQWASWLFGIIR